MTNEALIATTPPRLKIKFAKTKSHQTYRLKDGTKVPGASTIAKIGDDAGALLKWAWQCGQDGIDLEKARGEAADIGTLAHFMLECWHKGAEADLSEFSAEQQDKAANSFLKFLEFWDTSGFRMLHTEIQLVSELFRYGGTVDTVFEDANGRLGILDTKTSKGIYRSMWVQLAGYKQLVEENLQRPVERTLIVRIGKEQAGDMEVSDRALTARHWNVFQSALNLYNAIKEAD